MFDKIVGDIGSLFSNASMQNPANDAMKYYSQIPGQLQNIFSPYMQSGMNAVQPFMQNNPWVSSNYMNQISGLINNPTGLMNQIGSTYQQSPGYQWQLKQGLNAANNAAVAGGMAGSPMQQQNAATVASNLANQDYYNYVNHAMNLYNTGFGGLQNMYGIGGNIAGNMYNAGANLAGQYGSDLSSALMNQGNMQYISGVNQNNQQGNLFGAAADLIGNFL